MIGPREALMEVSTGFSFLISLSTVWHFNVELASETMYYSLNKKHLKYLLRSARNYVEVNLGSNAGKSW